MSTQDSARDAGLDDGKGQDGDAAEWKDRRGVALWNGDRVRWCGYAGRIFIAGEDNGANDRLRKLACFPGMAVVEWADGKVSNDIWPADAARWLEKVTVTP